MKEKSKSEEVIYRFKGIYVTKEDIKAFVYIMVLLALMFLPRNGLFLNIVQVVGFFAMMIMPLFMTTYYKFWITFLIGFIVILFSKYVYLSESLIQIRSSLVVLILFFLLFIIYIVMVIYDLYRSNTPKRNKLSVINKVNRFIFKIRFLYILIAIFLLVIVILLSFGYIYNGIEDVRGSESFYCVNNYFDGLYLSFTTFFTIGYGDIIPIHRDAIAFTMAQMAIGFTVSVLIVPLLIIMMQDLLKSNRKLYSIHKRVNSKRRITKHCQHSNRQPSHRRISRLQAHRHKQRL